MRINITVQGIASPTFAKYGSVTLPRCGDPSYACPEFNWWGSVASAELGTASFGIVEAINTGAYKQRTLEQHKRTQEILIPTESEIILVLAKPDTVSTEILDPTGLAAFKAPRGAIIILHAGVWHQAPMTTAERSAVIVIYKDKTGENDKTVIDLESNGIDVFANP